LNRPQSACNRHPRPQRASPSIPDDWVVRVTGDAMPVNRDSQEALHQVADANIPSDPDFASGFLKEGSYPRLFRAIYVERIITEDDGSAGQVEFTATARDGGKYQTTRVIHYTGLGSRRAAQPRPAGVVGERPLGFCQLGNQDD
jgi:hypothetical protein